VKDPKTRFSDRAENYAKYRPGYPREILEFLADKCTLTEDSLVADVGSGTGILSELFLENGNRVLAVEPNEEMRKAAEGFLGDYPRFESVAGAAEDTTLAQESVDLIAVANSLHWVKVEAARAEFSRLLKPGGRLAVIWNIPRSSGTPFLEALGRIVSAYRTDGGAGGDAEDVYGMTEKFFDGGSRKKRSYETGSFHTSGASTLRG